MQWSHWFAGLMDTRPTDRMYNCLPLYHSVGGVLATGAVLVGGGSVVIRDKFSARHFWPDVVRWECTLFQYIGELCRYLLHTESQPDETRHRLRMCCGNGLRADVWNDFKDRFRIPRILEFYAATEGNVSLFNLEGKPGAIGRIPPFLAHRFTATLVRFDAGREEPVRNEQGFCVRCAPNEVGEAIGKIVGDPANVAGRFEGYTSVDATEQKVLRDVFTPGDAWFRTGDLMRRDERGYFYFVDRVGDTFRWKGENVATSEVSMALCAFPGVKEANVFGVAIPGTDGRAGMAALVADERLELAALRTHLLERLPDYARPLFLRIRREIEVTATFKYTKTEFVRQGYDPAATTDPIYFADPERHAFVRLEVALCKRAVVVGTAILDRAVLAAEVVDPDRDLPRMDELHRPRREVLHRAHDDLGHPLRKLELVEPGPLLRERRALGPVQRDLEDAEAEQRALETDRRQRDPDLLEQLLLRQLGDLASRLALDHLHQHRGGRLADRAAASRELHLVHRLAVLAELDVDRDLVAAEGIDPLRLGVRVLDHPVPARVLVVVENDLAIQIFSHLPYPRIRRALWMPSTSRSISSGTV